MRLKFIFTVFVFLLFGCVQNGIKQVSSYQIKDDWLIVGYLESGKELSVFLGDYMKEDDNYKVIMRIGLDNKSLEEYKQTIKRANEELIKEGLKPSVSDEDGIELYKVSNYKIHPATINCKDKTVNYILPPGINVKIDIQNKSVDPTILRMYKYFCKD